MFLDTLYILSMYTPTGVHKAKSDMNHINQPIRFCFRCTITLSLTSNYLLLLYTLFTYAGVTSPHWIDHTSLGDMLSQDRDSPEKQPQKIWSISTQTFERNQIQASQQTSTNPAVATSVPAQTTCTVDNVNGTIVSSGSSGAREENFSGETDDGERTTSMAGSPTAAGGQQNIKPNRIAPPPPKTRKKTKEQNGVAATPNDAEYREPVPYVYPMHKLKQNLKQKQKQKDPTAPTGGNQSHEYAQPHAHIQVQQHDGVTIKQTSVTSNAKKHEYHSIDPKLKQPTGQYQDLLVNGLPRGQSLPTISTFTTLNS